MLRASKRPCSKGTRVSPRLWRIKDGVELWGSKSGKWMWQIGWGEVNRILVGGRDALEIVDPSHFLERRVRYDERRKHLPGGRIVLAPHAARRQRLSARRPHTITLLVAWR